MANTSRWVKLFHCAGAVNRFRLNCVERRQLAMMAALAYRPQEAQTRAWEAQIPADVDAPMHQLNDALAQMRPRDALTRAQQGRDIWALIPGGAFNFID